jgi:DNA-directed RNA polymerase specialized sigma24 family protein
MPHMTRPKTQSRLTAEAFGNLLRSLSVDPRERGARYEMLRQRLILFFLRRLLTSPEELADEVIDRLAQRLTGGLEVASVEAYALGIARHVAQEQAAMTIRENTGTDKFMENISAEPATTSEQAQEQERRLDAMERSLATLPEPEVQLLNSYYLTEQRQKIQARKHLARKLGLTQAALRKRIYSICLHLRESIRAQTESD